MARAKSNGSYAPLGATYYRDDAILEAGEAAELMFVRCLAFCADASSDGFITERQILMVVGMGLADVPARVATLVDVGVLEKMVGGYLVRSWLKWNRSSAQIGRHLKHDRARKAAARALENEFQTESARNPDGIRADSQNAGQVVRLPSTTQHYITTLPDESGDFETFYGLYPKRINKKAAKGRWITATKTTEPAVIIAALKAQLPGMAKTEPQYVPAPDVWLNKGKWADEITAPVDDPTDQWARAYRMNNPQR